jgi:alkylation response protein AidB-like acyl-CoA dehydrogenase
MSNIQAMLLLAWRVSDLYDNKKAEMGHIALAKAWITERSREVCRLGREICGGNGLLH